MPTYEYECKSCQHTFDAFQSMSDEPLKSCPKCNKELRRLINGGTGIIFKGSGYYVTDKNGKPAKEGSKAPATQTANSSCAGCAKTESCPQAVNS